MDMRRTQAEMQVLACMCMAVHRAVGMTVFEAVCMDVVVRVLVWVGVRVFSEHLTLNVCFTLAAAANMTHDNRSYSTTKSLTRSCVPPVART